MSDFQTSAVAVAPQRMELQRFPVPEIGEDGGLLRVELAGVCGSDPKNYKNRPQERLPVILGHEIVGEVVAIGPRASQRWNVRVGDRVVVEVSFGCGLCQQCVGGHYRFCQEKLGYGGAIMASVKPHLWGAFGEYLYLDPRARVHKISPELSAEAAVMVCAVLSNGVRWLRNMGGVNIGDTAVVVGPGPQGLAAVMAAQTAGAKHIVVLGLARDEARLSAARRLGATHTVAIDREDPRKLVAELTGGKMADVVIDVTGSPKSPPLALDLTRVMGTLVLGTSIGGGAQVPIEIDQIVAKEVRVQGVNTHDSTAVQQALAIAEAGRFPLAEMVTHRFSLDEADRAVRTVGGEFEVPGLIKAVIDPKL